MDAAPDFEALRARRNAAVQEMHQKMADEWGVPLQSLRSNFNPGQFTAAVRRASMDLSRALVEIRR